MKIQAKIRKEKVKKLRKQGLIPAVLYGKGEENLLLAVDKKEFIKKIREGGLHSIYTLDIDGTEKQVIIKDIQRDPALNEPEHIDFYKPDLLKKIKSEVEIVFVGESPAVKNLGGTLVKVMNTLTIKSLPQDCPNRIEVDISKLEKIGGYIKVGDLNFGDKIEILDNKDNIIVQVKAAENVEEELAKEVEEDVSKVERVETKKPKEEEEASNE